MRFDGGFCACQTSCVNMIGLNCASEQYEAVEEGRNMGLPRKQTERRRDGMQHQQWMLASSFAQPQSLSGWIRHSGPANDPYMGGGAETDCSIGCPLSLVGVIKLSVNWVTQGILVALYRAMRLRFRYGLESCDANSPRNVKNTNPAKQRPVSFAPLSPCW